MALGGTIKGKTTTLRLPTEDDLVAYARWMADMRLRALTRPWHEPAMPATWKERLTEQNKDKGTVLWSIDAEGKLVGLVRIYLGWEPHRSSAHISNFNIDPDLWRKGYGWDAALALHRYLFDYLDLRRATVNFTAEDSGARRIAERLGYAEFAHKHEVHYRNGSYVDELELLVDRPAWDERWAKTEREYQPAEAR
ncbi:MAG TPA: GNAT family protein [Methylomirabilota bacterium]|nr:GNAT family protein [Methylomirabilota bacterium]